MLCCSVLDHRPLAGRGNVAKHAPLGAVPVGRFSMDHVIVATRMIGQWMLALCELGLVAGSCRPCPAVSVGS
jgi:hypothetical protein